MRSLIASLILACFGWAAQSEEKGSVVVVELFTSEGCSSCPPADAILTELAEYENILPLALHVDYWDYLGWKDKFSIPKFTKRQEIYNSVLPSRYRLVTPQMVFHGRSQVAGARRGQIKEHLDKQSQYSDVIHLSVEKQETTFNVTISPRLENAPKADVFVVQYLPEYVSKIEAGENRGRTLTHTNIVTAWEHVGEWRGQEDWQTQHSISEGMLGAVIVQAVGNGPILAARKFQ